MINVTLFSSSKAVSSVISTVLMVALVVILAATVSVFVLDLTGEGNQPAPIVKQSSGELIVQDNSSGGKINLTHVAGDSLTASNLEIVVNAEDPCGKSGRLVNLPAPGNDLRPTSEYVRGDDIFDNSWNSVDGPIGEADAKWEAGETATFRLASSECQLDSGDTIIVRVVHTPTNSIIIEETLTAT
ncbi:MAG: flagellin-like protein [Natronomonas sp.]